MASEKIYLKRGIHCCLQFFKISFAQPASRYCEEYMYTSGGTRRCPGWEIEKADIWNRMEGRRLDRLDVICIIAIP